MAKLEMNIISNLEDYNKQLAETVRLACQLSEALKALNEFEVEIKVLDNSGK